MLERELRSDITLPLLESNLVFGEGNLDAEVLFIGEAPGVNEDRLGRPFVGRGGQLLDDCIKSIGWRREDVYITNIVKRRPPENRDPTPEEIAAYRPYLTRQIEIIDPRAIVPLGRFAMNYFLPDGKITRDQGKSFLVDGRMIIPILHPAAALRSTDMMNQFRKSFTRIPRILAGETSVPEKIDLPPARKESSTKEIKEEKNNSQTPLF